MKVYKLTSKDHQTRDGMQWGEGVEHRLPEKKNPQLCSPDLIHSYRNLNLGLILNPVQGRFFHPVVWEAEAEIVVEDWGKAGGFVCKTIKTIPIPEWYSDIEQRMRVYVQFSLLCAKSVLHMFEKIFPDNMAPHQAIKAAQTWLINPIPENAQEAADSALKGLTVNPILASGVACDVNDVIVEFYNTSWAVANNFKTGYANVGAAYSAFYAANLFTFIEIDFKRLADQAIEMITIEGDKDE